MNANRPWWRPDGFYVYAVLYLIFIYLPVLFLPLFSFNNSKYIAFPLKGFTLKWYEAMINNPLFINAFSIGGVLVLAPYPFNGNPFNGDAVYLQLLKENSGRNKTGR